MTREDDKIEADSAELGDLYGAPGLGRAPHRLTATPAGNVHASGPECFQRALELLTEAAAADDKADAGEHIGDTTDPTGQRRAAASLRADAAVYAELAHAAAIIDSAAVSVPEAWRGVAHSSTRVAPEYRAAARAPVDQPGRAEQPSTSDHAGPNGTPESERS